MQISIDEIELRPRLHGYVFKSFFVQMMLLRFQMKTYPYGQGLKGYFSLIDFHALAVCTMTFLRTKSISESSPSTTRSRKLPLCMFLVQSLMQIQNGPWGYLLLSSNMGIFRTPGTCEMRIFKCILSKKSSTNVGTEKISKN